MHTYDLDTLTGHQIVVKDAQDGEVRYTGWTGKNNGQRCSDDL